MSDLDDPITVSLRELPAGEAVVLAYARDGDDALAILGMESNSSQVPSAFYCLRDGGSPWTVGGSCLADGAGALCGWVYLCERVAEHTKAVTVQYGDQAFLVHCRAGWCAFVTRARDWEEFLLVIAGEREWEEHLPILPVIRSSM
jgi:hypothetical protein